MADNWINATVTNEAAAPTDRVSASTVPTNRNAIIIHNPSATASVTFTMDGTTPDPSEGIAVCGSYA